MHAIQLYMHILYPIPRNTPSRANAPQLVHLVVCVLSCFQYAYAYSIRITVEISARLKLVLTTSAPRSEWVFEYFCKIPSTVNSSREKLDLPQLGYNIFHAPRTDLMCIAERSKEGGRNDRGVEVSKSVDQQRQTQEDVV